MGIQLFLSWFYFSSGFCKMGPTFQYMFSSNLLAAKFMVDVPWAQAYRKTFYRDHDGEKGDYRLTPAAWYLATLAALVEMFVPLLTWTNNVRRCNRAVSRAVAVLSPCRVRGPNARHVTGCNGMAPLRGTLS